MSYAYPIDVGSALFVVNHSCEAPCLGSGYEFEIAVRALLPGEELTDDYGTHQLPGTTSTAPLIRRQNSFFVTE